MSDEGDQTWVADGSDLRRRLLLFTLSVPISLMGQ